MEILYFICALIGLILFGFILGYKGYKMWPLGYVLALIWPIGIFIALFLPSKSSKAKK